MTKLWGLAVAGLLAAGCGHAQTTGNASNDWSTPVGYASVRPEQVHRLETSPTRAPKGAERQVFYEEQAPIGSLAAQSGVAPPVERGTALPPDTVTPQETLPPPVDQ
ncbi:MAG: hypothetical protein ACXVDD_09295 [Polyangia bacterium]